MFDCKILVDFNENGRKDESHALTLCTLRTGVVPLNFSKTPEDPGPNRPEVTFIDDYIAFRGSRGYVNCELVNKK